jgi:phosphate transport system permease protein
MAAVIANEFAEAADAMHVSALIEIALVLFVFTLGVNLLSRVVIRSLGRQRHPRAARRHVSVAEAA